MTAKRKSGEASAELLEIMAKAGKQGVRVSQVDMGIRINSVQAILDRLCAKGTVVKVKYAYKDVVYYLPQHAPTNVKQWTPPEARSLTGTIRATRVVLDHDQPAVIPSDVKVTICPGWRGSRYAADPGIAGRGVISQDWREGRGGV